MPFPRKIHWQTPLKMIEPRKTALMTVKKQQKQKQNAFHGNMNERTYIVCFTKQSFLRYFLISISAVTLKLISNGQNHIHFWLIQVLKNSMTWYFLTFRSRSSKLEFVYSGVSPVMLRSRRENAHLLVNPIPKLTIVLIWKTPPCLKFGKTSNRDEKNLPQRKLWVWAANNARSHKNLITPKFGERVLLRKRWIFALSNSDYPRPDVRLLRVSEWLTCIS